jgi:hypothetical protein
MDAALRRLSLAADPGVWVCAVCKNEIPDAVDGYVSVPRGIRVCSKVCLNSLPAPESVLVPGPDVSAIDLSEDPEDEEDLDG